MRLIIFGAGAIGGTLGSCLYQSGYDVLLIARGDHGLAISDHGLTYRNPVQTITQPIPTVSHPKEITFRETDVVILTVKSQDSVNALSDLAGVAPSSTPIFCAQNGVDNERLALRFFERVYGMLVLCPGTHLTPGEVIHSAYDAGGCFDTGCYPTGIDDTAKAVAQALSLSGFAAAADPNVMALKYAKLLQNLGNPLQLLSADFEHSRSIMRLLRQEALACFSAAHIDCADKAVASARFTLVKTAAVPDAPRGGSSTWQSVARGRQHIETPFLNGEICSLGRTFGIDTPANARLQALALAAAAGGFELLSSGDLLAALSA